MSERRLTDEFAEELVRACRTAVGDELRSVTYFTVDSYEQLYIRDDLERGADLGRFAENERLGFRSEVTYRDSELGVYEFTIRAFEHGYLTRVIDEDHGVFVTTDEMPIGRFEELAAAVRGVLREH